MVEIPPLCSSKFYSPFKVKIDFLLKSHVSSASSQSLLPLFLILDVLIICTKLMSIGLSNTVTAKGNDRNLLITSYISQMRYLDPERLSDLPKATQLHSIWVRIRIHISWLSWASFHSITLSGIWFVLFPLLRCKLFERNFLHFLYIPYNIVTDRYGSTDH